MRSTMTNGQSPAVVSFLPPELPMQTDDYTLDFNDGARVRVPAGNYHVRFTDMDTMNVLFEADFSDAVASSTKKYYVRFRVELWKDGQLILTHDLDLKGRNVHIVFPIGTLGDIIAWFPYAEEFRLKHGCKMYCTMQDALADLFRLSYPDIIYLHEGEEVPDCYATYYMGLYPMSDEKKHNPIDHRVAGLQKVIPPLLGLDYRELRPELKHCPERPIAEPYVCIATKTTAYAKFWNNPTGWAEVIAYLKEKGYRVLCIDKDRNIEVGGLSITMPEGAEDFTGNLPLQERVDLLAHADFFIGLSSGLSWLAWAAGTPVILISGFSLPFTEFYTPYRVINYHTCTGCWNNPEKSLDLKNFFSCPEHAGTDRAFECSRLITAGHVCREIDRLMNDFELDPRREKPV